MEKQLKKNLLKALGASGALLAVGAATALWRSKRGEAREEQSVEGVESHAQANVGTEPPTLSEEKSPRRASAASA